jgi:hypothetical protein
MYSKITAVWNSPNEPCTAEIKLPAVVPAKNLAGSYQCFEKFFFQTLVKA